MLENVDEFFEDDEEKSLEDSLKVDQAGEATDRDLHIATAVLLVEMASIDREISAKEGEAVVAAMSGQFGIDQQELPELIKVAIASRKEKGKLAAFFDCINSRFNPAQKKRVLAMLWKVMMADGKMEKAEQRLLRRVKDTLEISEEDTEEALKMAQHGEV